MFMNHFESTENIFSFSFMDVNVICTYATINVYTHKLRTINTHTHTVKHGTLSSMNASQLEY